MKTPDIVIFRRWRSGDREVVALFPLEPADYSGLHCNSYVHVGGWGAAQYHVVMAQTREAVGEDAEYLAQEIERTTGRTLLRRKRATPKDHILRARIAREMK